MLIQPVESSSFVAIMATDEEKILMEYMLSSCITVCQVGASREFTVMEGSTLQLSISWGTSSRDLFSSTSGAVS
jgi:hypothetical protein